LGKIGVKGAKMKDLKSLQIINDFFEKEKKIEKEKKRRAGYICSSRQKNQKKKKDKIFLRR
jgi:predicted RNA-binding protein YlxR (DUF448 family)